MKYLLPILIILYSVSLPSKDYNKTEKIIQSILSEERDNQNGSRRKNGKITDQNAEQKKEDDADEKKKKSSMNGKDEVLLKTGIQLYESGLYDASLAKFNDMKKNYSSSPFIDTARMWSGRILMKKSQYDDAIKEFDNINDPSGEYPYALYYKAEAYRYKNDYINAIEYYQRVSSLYPGRHPLAEYSILATGKIYLSEKKGYQALEAAARIISNYKDTDTIDDAYYLVAKVYEKDPLLKDLEISRKILIIFLKKSEQNQKYFSNSPLLPAVKADLENFDRTYFKMER